MEGKGLESQEEVPLLPLPSPPDLARTVGSAALFRRGWSLPLWLRNGGFCLALGALSLPGPLSLLSLLLPGHRSAQQPRFLSAGPVGPGPSPCGCRWGSPGGVLDIWGPPPPGTVVHLLRAPAQGHPVPSCLSSVARRGRI